MRDLPLVQIRTGFTFGEEYFMVDLVFYNRLRCFVLFDLKIGELKDQDMDL